MHIGYIGLGKMGYNMVLRLLEKGYGVTAFDVSDIARARAQESGALAVRSLQEFKDALPPPRLFWIMVPHKVVDTVLDKLTPVLSEGDTVIDGGNSFYKDSMRRAEELEKKNIHFMDVGVSGGPRGAKEGACLMIGGKKEKFSENEALFKDLSVPHGYGHMGPHGAGHFVKMVHNGIEYGMMQSIAEGFAIMKNAPFGLDLPSVADVYNHGSVIESRLIGWTKKGFQHYGKDLQGVSGTVGHSGEGTWTVDAAKELGIPSPAIEGALHFREASEDTPSYTGKILSMLRNQFGGHDV